MTLAMTKDQREAFLADVHIGVLSLDDPGRGPLTAPIWYAYEPGGELRMVIGESSRKARLLPKTERISLVAQTERSPFQYVSVEGPFTLDTPDYERDIRAMAIRYLGEEGAKRYLGLGDREPSVAGQWLIRMTPERWLTVDYGKLGL